MSRKLKHHIKQYGLKSLILEIVRGEVSDGDQYRHAYTARSSAFIFFDILQQAYDTNPHFIIQGIHLDVSIPAAEKVSLLLGRHPRFDHNPDIRRRLVSANYCMFDNFEERYNARTNTWLSNGECSFDYLAENDSNTRPNILFNQVLGKDPRFMDKLQLLKPIYDEFVSDLSAGIGELRIFRIPTEWADYFMYDTVNMGRPSNVPISDCYQRQLDAYRSCDDLLSFRRKLHQLRIIDLPLDTVTLQTYGITIHKYNRLSDELHSKYLSALQAIL